MIARTVTVYLALAAASVAANSSGSQSIEGVVAAFRITTPVIKKDDTLKVVTVYRNTRFTTVHFPYMDPSHFSEIYRKGARNPVVGYYIGTPATHELILRGLESQELEEEVDLRAFEHLPPGEYEIRFCFHLGMLPEEIQGNYRREYPYDSLVIPWSSQRYQFTIAK